MFESMLNIIFPNELHCLIAYTAPRFGSLCDIAQLAIKNVVMQRNLYRFGSNKGRCLSIKFVMLRPHILGPATQTAIALESQLAKAAERVQWLILLTVRA